MLLSQRSSEFLAELLSHLTDAEKTALSAIPADPVANRIKLHLLLNTRMNGIRLCTKCGIEKPTSEFGRSSKKCGLVSCCKSCRKLDRVVYWRNRYRANAESFRRYYRGKARERREKILSLYGGACECCRTTHSEFLCVDHVNGDGAAERRVLKGPQVYMKLVKAGRRLPGYRLLCANCNMAYARNGCCPHQHGPNTESTSAKGHTCSSAVRSEGSTEGNVANAAEDTEDITSSAPDQSCTTRSRPARCRTRGTMGEPC